MSQILAIPNPAIAALLEQHPDIDFRYATNSDLTEVKAIEQLTSPYPWSDKLLDESINKLLVITNKQEIIGFAVVALVAQQAELHLIAIHPKAQSQGYGQLILALIIESMPASIESFFLEVRVSNCRAIRLYQRLGFVQFGERKDYYRNGLGTEDAIIMARENY
jgi:[ribosomal protein S18]-alanine N-acetyltransferase